MQLPDTIVDVPKLPIKKSRRVQSKKGIRPKRTCTKATKKSSPKVKKDTKGKEDTQCEDQTDDLIKVITLSVCALDYFKVAIIKRHLLLRNRCVDLELINRTIARS